MDDDATGQLFDATAARTVVLARRPPGACAVECVVSDVVWGEVVRLLRWATAGTRGDRTLQVGAWWRLAGGCADLLRRLPRLCDEIAEPWGLDGGAPVPPELDAGDRIALAADRVVALLQSPRPVPLRTLAAEVDALGSAALSALAARPLHRGPW
ncbi:hypothetical protein E9529_09505 [Blastococcus sp. KM273128]|uniref:hypothetical protein n=1 Tax=Blastococcus sp. KM273128 TaxID=2570314 RepID=UPI001F194280|nr:hypothetical protein [Blastococcus sp. KM273128]MCF6744511.1 hypothetical protein [Blastococcus sp. KM273128]